MNVKNLFFKMKYRLFRPQSFDAYQSLRKSQFWSIEQQKEVSQAKKIALVSNAFEHIPFYEKLYKDAGFQAGDVQQSDFFEKLPILKKEHIQNCFDELTYSPLKKYASYSTTGGSTGEPTKIMYDKRCPVEALGWRMMSWWGISPSCDGAYVWRMRRTKGLAVLCNSLLWWPTRKLRLDASSMDDSDFFSFIKQFNNLKPPLLQGYVGAIAELAEFVKQTGVAVHNPKAIWLTSAPITEVQRQLVESAFNAPVYDQYGCCEVPHIAAQCQQRGGLHVNNEFVSVEIVDGDDNPVANGLWGKVLLTKLDERIFPLIRYEVGDRGRYLEKQCTCGVKLPLLDNIKGRLTDVIKLPSGKIISGEYLTTIFDDFPDIVNAFCVIQKKNGSIIIKIVPSPLYTDAVGEEVRMSLANKIQAEVEVDLQKVDKLDHDKGKIRFVTRET